MGRRGPHGSFPRGTHDTPRYTLDPDVFPGPGDFLQARPKDTPFCFWFGSRDPHRPYVKGSGVAADLKPADVFVPPYLPDTPEWKTFKEKIGPAFEKYKNIGYPIEFHHRANREGFKAGALQEGLKTATGEFIAIFDADFIPPVDFLRRTVPYFSVNPSICP